MTDTMFLMCSESITKGLLQINIQQKSNHGDSSDSHRKSFQYYNKELSAAIMSLSLEYEKHFS